MADDYIDEMEDEPFYGDLKSSKRILTAIRESQRAFDTWQNICDRVDKMFSQLTGFSDNAMYVGDREFSLFWATIEVIKPSIYSRPPVPVVGVKFKDRDPVKRTASELLERCSISGFDQTDIDQVMLDVRDDLAINARGQAWITYETAEETGETEAFCVEHLDRWDFCHEPARKWADVSWVARRAWLTKREMRKRFYKKSGDAYQQATYAVQREAERNGAADKTLKCGVWEVWSKAEKKVYWVAEGVDVILDSDKPHLRLSRFFPCPRPAYGTLQRRSLIPVPDVTYYESQLEQIAELTYRIHGLIDSLRVKGLYPAGGDIGDAVEMALKMDDDAKVLVPVNAAILQGAASLSDLIVWMPIDIIANTIQACVLTRTQLIQDVQQLVGISDIMRGETDAQETLGAQALKAQYGAVRIRDKVAELVRFSRDIVRIAAEIMCEDFDDDTLLEMSQMDLPTNAQVKKRVKEFEEAARTELEALTDKAEAMLQDPQAAQQGDMQQAQQQFAQAQQQIVKKYRDLIAAESEKPTQEQVFDLLHDEKTRPFVFDIETDSTIYPDEQAEKASRNEFAQAFAQASAGLAPLVATGPAGATLAGELLKFQLGAYRAGRQLDDSIDEWIKEVQSQPPSGEDDANAQIAEANKILAEAEQQKAQAAMASVQAKAMQDKADNDRKMAELQMKYQENTAKFQQENDKLKLQMSKQDQEFAAKMADLDAKQNLMQAQTAQILASIGLDVRKQDLEEYRVAADAQARQVDQSMAAQNDQFSQAQAVDNAQRADRGEDRADRGQEFSERQAQMEPKE